MKKDDLRGFTRSLVAVLGFLLTAMIFLGDFMDRVESRIVDFRFDARPDRPLHPEVAVIVVDEADIKELGRWPWPRNLHAKLIDKLTSAGIKAVAFDILFSEPDKDRPWADEQLARAAAKSGRVIFAAVYKKAEPDGSLSDILSPLPLFSTAGASVNVFADADGIYRKIPLWVLTGEDVAPSLSLAALSTADQKSAESLVSEAGPSLSVADYRGDADGPRNQMFLNFTGGDIKGYSFADVLKGRVETSVFKDKIVFVGGVALALFDTVAVPNAPNFPGLWIHATALDNYLNKNWIRKAGAGWTIFTSAVLSMVCGLAAAFFPVWAGAVSIFLLVGYYFFSQFLFMEKYVLLNFTWPFLSVLSSYVVVFFLRFRKERKEKQLIRDAFSRAVSDKIMRVILSDGAALNPGGEDRTCTVFFSDLVGFTALSEAMKPHELVPVMNEYFEAMSGVIFKYDGLVDKYIGDAIMAFWNAPITQAGHERLACFTALDQMESLKDLQKRFAERNLPLIDCRIGLNTGEVIFGKMGSAKQSSYTVMGDHVNLASRLEGANKVYHTRVMISEFTYAAVKDDVEARPLDMIRVKGKSVPIQVYELLARKDVLTPDISIAMGLYMEGLKFYRDKKFLQALEFFEKTLNALPDDGPSRLHAERCRAFLAVPPPPDWDGVFVMTSK